MKNAKKRAPSISIRWQLMFFIGAMTLLTVGLIWGIITYAPVSYTHLDVYKRQHQPKGQPGQHVADKVYARDNAGDRYDDGQNRQHCPQRRQHVPHRRCNGRG